MVPGDVATPAGVVEDRARVGGGKESTAPQGQGTRGRDSPPWLAFTNAPARMGLLLTG